MIRLGTSGFSYDDWVGPFYPADLARQDWLSYYAEQFDTVELNVTYYRVPARRTVESWVGKTPPGFVFSVKAHQELTHDRSKPDFDGFLRAIEPLQTAGKLACILAQFPHSFAPSAEAWRYLEVLSAGLASAPVVVEFRHRGWAKPEVFERLEGLRVGFCCVDEPRLPGLMPPTVQATSRVAYVRFHGRNAEKWWNHDQAWERYDYTYRDEELRGWVDDLHRLEDSADVVLVYANNHYRSQSVDTLRALKRLMAETDGPSTGETGGDPQSR